MALDGKTSWSFGNTFARNVSFGADNSSSSHTNNRKNKFLVLHERPTHIIMIALVQQNTY